MRALACLSCAAFVCGAALGQSTEPAPTFEYRYLHSAVHGFADEGNPARSGLVLSQGPVFRSYWTVKVPTACQLLLLPPAWSRPAA